MIFAQQPPKLSDSEWQRINMRKVSHLIGAEMLHNLYNRHWPLINSLRFRHTITNYYKGTVESYAPKREWDFMQNWLSRKFINLDPVLIREIEAILNPTYSAVDELINKIDSIPLENRSNQDLALLLIDIMDIPLGDIYKLNVVQIEYSLNFTLHEVLSKYEPNLVDRNELLSKIIAPGELTIAQEEDVDFNKIVKLAKDKHLDRPDKDGEIYKKIIKHYDLYAPKHCAYGESPPSIDDYLDKFINAIRSSNKLVDIKTAKKIVNNQVDESESILKNINDPKLTILCRLAAKIGVFRDHNKAKLGETVVRRIAILDEISKRMGVNRDDLNLYLVSELVELLSTSKKLKRSVIDRRLDIGMVFVRNEDVSTGIAKLIKKDKKISNSDTITGICASPGMLYGKAKIIKSKVDIAKINKGDIMVAVGTDFDLLEIMHMSAGIITEEGGLLSHASVVCRELKKPCLIGVEQATKILKDGQEIELNATDGKVVIQ